MVPSKNEEKVFQHDKQHKKPDPVPLTVTESDDNTTDISETNRKPLVVTESDDNTTAISDTNKKTAEELNAEEWGHFYHLKIKKNEDDNRTIFSLNQISLPVLLVNQLEY